MGWNFRNAEKSIFAEINITPLTDVMLVLLVIFMVTTPLIMAESFRINLPKALTSEAGAGPGVTIGVSVEGLISVNGKEVGKGDLTGVLRDEIRRAADKTVILKADGSVRHSVVVDILDRAKLAGAAKLSIATRRPED